MLVVAACAPSGAPTTPDAPPAGGHEVAFDYGGATLYLTLAPFDLDSFETEPCEYDADQICAIDGALYFGSESLNATEIDSVLVAGALEVNGRRVPLDVSGMVNPTPRQDRIEVERVSPDLGIWEIHGRFGDGGAVYEGAWEVRSGRSRRLALAHSTWFFRDEI